MIIEFFVSLLCHVYRAFLRIFKFKTVDGWYYRCRVNSAGHHVRLLNFCGTPCSVCLSICILCISREVDIENNRKKST